MREPAQASSLLQCFEIYRLKNVTPIRKESPETSAWFASTGEHDFFCKLYPHDYAETRAAIEIAIAGANVHPAIVPLRQIAACPEGILLLYDRVAGENLGPMEARGRFQALLSTNVSSRFPPSSPPSQLSARRDLCLWIGTKAT
jgi:hypothetical protein